MDVFNITTGRKEKLTDVHFIKLFEYNAEEIEYLTGVNIVRDKYTREYKNYPQAKSCSIYFTKKNPKGVPLAKFEAFYHKKSKVLIRYEFSGDEDARLDILKNSELDEELISYNMVNLESIKELSIFDDCK